MIPSLVSLGFARAKSYEYCPGLIILGEIEPSLSEVETNLVCGQQSNQNSPNGAENSAWARIPFSQMQYNMKNFLQERGYHSPIFTRGADKGEKSTPNTVAIGSKTAVTKLSIKPIGADLIHLSKKRKVIGQPMTPALLNDIERWVTSQLQSIGYGCPEVVAEGYPQTGEVEIQMNPGPLVTFGSVRQEELPGLHNDLLRRYDAFVQGEVFDAKLLSVTTNRIKAEGVVEYAHFSHKCVNGRAELDQKVFAAQPVLLTLGIGANTEGAIHGKGAWTNTRIGSMGSQIGLTLYGSSRLQSLQGNHLWYFQPEVSRTLFNSTFEFSHRQEDPYAILLATVKTGLEHRFELGAFGGKIFAGPSMTLLRTLRGTGAPEAQVASLDGKLTLQTHEFEYYISSPQDGVKIEIGFSLANRNIISSVTAQRGYLNFESLWNINSFDPPLFIVGLRGGIFTTFTADDPASMNLLPANFFYYLGGSGDLRGFGRKSLLATNGSGGLTSAFAGIEVRLSHTLPYGFEPFIFTDVGALGSNVGALNGPIYTSPGFGIRWASPVGIIRATAARGFTDSLATHTQLFIGFGEEF